MKNKKYLYVVFAAMLITMGIVSFYYWYQATHFVSTEDARVDVQIVKILPQVTGEIVEIKAVDGDLLAQNDMVARISDTTLTSGINQELTILRSPIAGTILKTIQNTKEIALPGQPLALIANLDDVYITANIEETELAKVRPGQAVEIKVDVVPNAKFQGYVQSIGEATNSAFSSSATSGTFTKITQRIPVKISISDIKGQKLLPGMNAEVKIHLK